MPQIYEQKGLPIVPTGQTLRAISVYPFPFAIPVIFLAGVSSEGDGLQGFFQWVAGSFATDDGVNIFKPNWVQTSASGRWTRLTGTLSAGTNFNQRTVLANDSFAPSDYLLRCDATAGPLSIILPAISGATNRAVAAKKIDSSSNPVTVVGDTTIDGRASWTINAQYEGYAFGGNGTTWDVMP